MSYMKGDLLSRTRKLVKGLAKPTPVWLKAMEEAPPVVFPRCESKIKRIELPEDVYVKRFFKKHPSSLESLRRDPDKLSGFDPPPARVFAWRVVELKEEGVSEAEAMALADMEYKAEKKAKKAAYLELKKVNHLQGKEPPPNPYPRAVKEIKQVEKNRFITPRVTEIRKRYAEGPFGGGGSGWGSALRGVDMPVGNNNFLNSGTGGGSRTGGWGNRSFLRNNSGWLSSWRNNSFSSGNFNSFPRNSNGGNFSGGGGGNGNFLNNRSDGNFGGGGGRPGGWVDNNFPNNNNGATNNGDGGWLEK